jgi:O-antigen ligase
VVADRSASISGKGGSSAALFVVSAGKMSTTRRLLACVVAAILVAAWLVPLHIPPWVTAQSDILAALAAGLLAFVGLAGGAEARDARHVGVPSTALALAVLALIPLVQFASGLILFSGDGLIATLYLACAAWSVMWSARVNRLEPGFWPETLAFTLLGGAVLSGGVALVQRLEIDVGPLRLYVVDVRPGHPPGANLAQPNQLSTLLGLGLVGLGLLFERRRVGVLVSCIAACFLTLAMGLTQSRTPLLLFVALLLGLLVLRGRTRVRTSPVAVGAFGLGWLASFAAWSQIAAALEIPAMRATLIARAQVGPRTVIWQQLWDAVWLRPWTGYGWNQVSVAQMAVAAETPNSRLVEHSHNLLLDLLLWNGVPITMAIVALALWWLWRAVRYVHSSSGVFGLLTMFVLLAHAMVEFPLEYAYFLVPFAMAIGIVEIDMDRPAFVTIPRRGLGVAAIVYFSVLGWAAVDYMNVESEFREMRFTVARLGQPMTTEPPQWLRTGFTQLAAQHRFWLSTPRRGMARAEVELSDKVSQRFGFAPLIYRRALIQGLHGDPEGARLSLRRLTNLHGAIFLAAATEEIRRMSETDYPELRALLPP